MAFVDRLVGSAARDARAKWFAKDGSLTPELQARFLDRAAKAKTPDSLKAVAKFAEQHNTPSLAADMRYRDALVRNSYEQGRFGKDFPVYSETGNKDFIRHVIDGKTTGEPAFMLAQLADATKLDANSGTLYGCAGFAASTIVTVYAAVVPTALGAKSSTRKTYIPCIATGFPAAFV